MAEFTTMETTSSGRLVELAITAKAPRRSAAKVDRLSDFLLKTGGQECWGRVGPSMSRQEPVEGEPPVTERGGEERDRNLEATIRQRSQANAVRVFAVNDCGECRCWCLAPPHAEAWPQPRRRC